MNWKCKLGLHNWLEEERKFDNGNEIRYCNRCGKVQMWAVYLDGGGWWDVVEPIWEVSTFPPIPQSELIRISGGTKDA